MSKGNSDLAGIVEQAYLQELQDSVSKAANVTAYILDASGKPITMMTNPRGICKTVGDIPCDGGFCAETQNKLCRMARDMREPATMTCPRSGMAGAAIPIFLDDQFLGAWIIGQVRFRGASLEPFINAAHKTGLRDAEVERLLREIPEVSLPEFEMIVEFMSIVTGEVVKLTSSNLVIREKNERLRKLSESLKCSMETLYTFTDAADAGIYVCDFRSGEIIMCNNYYAGFFGKTKEEMTGRICYEGAGCSSNCPGCPREKLIDVKDNPVDAVTWETYMERHDLWLQRTSRALLWPDGRLVQMNTVIDITQRRRMEEELSLMAFFDKELRIPNSERMERDIAEGRAYESLVIVDIENLRRINGIFGRECGSALLKAVRDYIMKMGIPGGYLYRGELSHFCILFEKGEGSADVARRAAEKIHERCKEVWEISANGRRQNIFASAEVCVLPVDDYLCAVPSEDAQAKKTDPFERMYGAVEHSLDIARKTDSVVVFDDDAREDFWFGMKLEQSLKNAVRENMRGFQVVYQPIIDVGAGIWRGLEALCRWESPEFGSVTPAVFIPVAESCGLINTIDLWVLEQAVRQAKTWKLDRVKNFLLEINLSPFQIGIPDLDKRIMEVLREYDYPPEKIGLEVTETCELNFSKAAMAAIERLNEMGVVIILDDFGTGYSTFSTLQKLPVKLLKTDRSFITGMESDGHMRHLINVMVSLAHGSDIKFVAEGVESDSQARLLIEQGADFFQGYFFSRPLEPEKMEQKLGNFRHPMESLVSMRRVQYDKGRFGVAENGLGDAELRPPLREALDRCVMEIFINPEMEDAMDAMLAHMGRGVAADRIHLLLKEAADIRAVEREWRGEGIPSMDTSRQDTQNRQRLPCWFDMMDEHELMIVTDVETLDEDIRAEALRHGIRAFIRIPVWKAGRRCGYIEVQHCGDVHAWTKEETQILNNFSDLVAVALERVRLQGELAVQSKMRESILDNIETALYVSDLETNRIVFANEALKRMHGNARLVGRLCWEALHNREERCPFCPIPQLLKKPGQSYQWEYYNENLRKNFRICDSIIPWVEGKLAHLEYAMSMGKEEVS